LAGGGGGARAAYGNVNFFLEVSSGLGLLVVVVLVVSAVDDTICCLVQTMLDAVDSLVQTVTDGVDVAIIIGVRHLDLFEGRSGWIDGFFCNMD